MERFFGFDLGDAESAIARLDRDGKAVPAMLAVCGERSFITAYARTETGEIYIGEKACLTADATDRKLRFKSRFLRDQKVQNDVKCFAAGVLGELYGSGDLVKHEDCCFYIGCPAGWNKNVREQYRAIFERTGYPPVRIISESRAAMISACQSKHLQVGYNILSKPVLVIDIGSSTTDFAYICGGKEVKMQTAGEVLLGGGIMDELLLSEAVKASGHEEEIRKIFAESEPWKNYCEFAARRLKEKYFSDEEYWETRDCTETVMIYYRGRLRLPLKINAGIAQKLQRSASPSLSGKSFYEVFYQSLKKVHDSISGKAPELIFLTGGVSKLPAVRDWCMEVFPDSVVILGQEPEFSVARGLAYSGRIDEELRGFKEELEELKQSTVVEDIVSTHMEELFKNIVEKLVEPIMENAAVPVFRRWRNGGIDRLCDTDEALQKEIEIYLRTDNARELLGKIITSWLRPVADELEEHTHPICIRHNIPYTALSLNTYFATSDIDIHLNARDMFAVKEITLMIDSIISIFIGLICGGGGIALISSGPGGIFAGALISLAVLFIGKGKMEEALLKVKIPKPLRKLVPANAFNSRMKNVTESVKERFYESLEKDSKNEEITNRLVNEISEQIERCLTRMAKVVEIPLG
ncbi:MAG: Hsp70 family protein [Parasporobacterium sp.]|nr:Hsp70 family protein [Parasporobacterium sp.]